ncbi:MAG: hypothetical protein ACFFG0_04955, partial [Candidatus Thorarchaeota archaeon]
MTKKEEDINEYMKSYGYHFWPHYTLKEIKDIEMVKAFFTHDEGNDLNWCFLSTSGVHGSYTTLDEMEQLDYKGNYDITILIIQPRLCNLFYGNIPISKEDVSYLRHLVSTTIEAIKESQK